MNAGSAIAGGRWLLFLHADSELPADWMNVIAQTDQRAHVAAGAFRLALASRDWPARVVEVGVRLRVALFGLPYGDQALFVRSQIFRAIGGYRDLPLMEDVDLVRRVKQVGRLVQSRAVVLTSARRWKRDGWVRRSAWNAFLATRFLLGASPARLAQRYFGRKAAAVVMMARAPWTGGKTRLAVAGDDAAHDALRHALFLDTLDVVTSVRNVEYIIACEPPGACERMREFAGPTVDVIAQRGGDLGRRIAHVFEDTFRLGVEAVVVVGSDLPDLPSRLLQDALAALRGRKDRIVLGPAGDGGYYLIGLNRPHPALFERIEWSTERVLAQTLDAARTLGVRTVLLDKWTDVDEAADLHRFLTNAADSTGRRTRSCVLEHLARRSIASPQAGHAADFEVRGNGWNG
jgi:rSAM/selenodomain-associated transferase 1